MDSWVEESEALKDLPDARQIGKVKYPLDEILLLCLVAVVAGAETITEIARFGRPHATGRDQDSMRVKRKAAASDDDYLARLIAP